MSLADVTQLAPMRVQRRGETADVPVAITAVDPGQLAVGSEVQVSTIARQVVVVAKTGGGAPVPGTVTAPMLADNAVERRAILAGAVDTVRIAQGAVTEALLATDAVTTTKIKPGSVETPHLVAGGISADRLVARSISSDRIAANAITGNEIAAQTITGGKISANSITAADAVFATAAIKSADVETLSASKLSAGTIDASVIAVTNLNADNIKSGTITGRTISGGVVTGSTVRTADTGPRVELTPSDTDRIKFFSAGGQFGGIGQLRTSGGATAGLALYSSHTLRVVDMSGDNRLGIIAGYGDFTSMLINGYTALHGGNHDHTIHTHSDTTSVTMGWGYVHQAIRFYGSGTVDLRAGYSSNDELQARPAGVTTGGLAADYKWFAASNFRTVSSRRYKRNIKPAPGGALAKVRATPTYTYEMGDQPDGGDALRQLGFILEEMPDDVIADDGYLIGGVLALGWQSTAELAEQFEWLKGQVEELAARVPPAPAR